ncbi:uncharacterized protein [Choristoneura fumiferana]|uniref:uncharacterized protein n=1 Tax=Choristoneura fumiferana TaxID=7141 RepID=UPI003D15E729
MSSLEHLIQKRGYVKASITRLFDGIEEMSTHSTEMLQIKKQRCVSAFEAYERLNESILCLDPKDAEDVSSYEHAQLAQAFQLERDSKTEPKVDEFIGYLEKRALAMENAEPTRDKAAAAPKSVYAVTKEKQGCHYCPATICDAERSVPAAACGQAVAA